MARALIHSKHKFLVEIFDRVASASFQKCSELSWEAAEITYYEGGTVIPFKDAGRLTFTDVTLERGTATSLAFLDWMLSVNNAAVAVPGSDGWGRGEVLPLYKANAAILQLDRDNTRIREWSLINAWPKKYVAGDWDNTVDEANIESLTLAYDFFEVFDERV